MKPALEKTTSPSRIANDLWALQPVQEINKPYPLFACFIAWRGHVNVTDT